MQWNRTRHRNPRGSLPALCERLGDAIKQGDDKAVAAREAAVEKRIPEADPAELSVGVLWLTQALSAMPATAGARFGPLAGRFLWYGAYPPETLDLLVSRTIDVFDQAARFPGLWHQAGGGRPPDARQAEALPGVLERLRAGADRLDVPAADAGDIAHAWFTHGWGVGLFFAFQNEDVLDAVPQRQRLTKAAVDLAGHDGIAPWVKGLGRLLGGLEP